MSLTAPNERFWQCCGFYKDGSHGRQCANYALPKHDVNCQVDHGGKPCPGYPPNTSGPSWSPLKDVYEGLNRAYDRVLAEKGRCDLNPDRVPRCERERGHIGYCAAVQGYSDPSVKPFDPRRKAGENEAELHARIKERRERIATAVLPGLLAAVWNPTTNGLCHVDPKVAVANSVWVADALIAELDRPGRGTLAHASEVAHARIAELDK